MLSRTSESILGKRKRAITLVDYHAIAACNKGRSTGIIVRSAQHFLTLLNQTDCRVRLLLSGEFTNSFTGMIDYMRTVAEMNQDTVVILYGFYKSLLDIERKQGKTQEDWRAWFQGVQDLIGCLTHIVETY